MDVIIFTFRFLAELTEVSLQLLELGVRKLAVLGLTRYVLEQPIGFAGDLVVLLGSSGTELLDERGGARLAEARSRDKRGVAPELLYLSGDGVESLASLGPLGQDADTVAQIWGADFLEFTPDRRPFARWLGGDGVEEQQPWDVYQNKQSERRTMVRHAKDTAAARHCPYSRT